MKTYKEWTALRRHVVKGQKAKGWTPKGEALFSEEQTAKQRDTFTSVGDYDYDEDIFYGMDRYK